MGKRKKRGGHDDLPCALPKNLVLYDVVQRLAQCSDTGNNDRCKKCDDQNAEDYCYHVIALLTVQPAEDYAGHFFVCLHDLNR